MRRFKNFSRVHVIMQIAVGAALIMMLSPQSSHAQATLQIDSIGRELNEFTESLVRQAEDPNQQPSFADFKLLVSKPFSSLPAVVQLAERIGFSRARETEVKAQKYPQIALSAGGQETSYDTRSTSRSESASLNVSQLVYDFGGVNASLKSNEEKTEALILESRLQQSQMLLSLIRSYLEWARASYRLQMSEDFVSTREQFLDLVKSRESIGGSSRADVIRAETKLIEALDELPFSVKAVEQANASLVEMYGAIPESVQLFQTPLLGDEMQRHETTGLYPIKIQAIDKSIASAKAQLRAAEIRRYGVIRFDGTYQNVNDPIFNTSESTRLQLSYQVDIFSGYAQNARIDQARFQLSELEAERDRVKKEQARVLSVAFADYRSQVASTRSRVKLVRAAKRASDITRELFVFNRGSISDIFKAQEDYLSASRNLLDTMINAQLSYYTLLHERGYLLEKFELTL